MVLFIDDMKLPQQFGLDASTPHARTGEEALRMIEECGYDELYLDHDLSEEGMTGYDLVKVLVEKGIKIKKVTIISLNMVGVGNIIELCLNHGIPYDRKLLPSDAFADDPKPYPYMTGDTVIKVTTVVFNVLNWVLLSLGMLGDRIFGTGAILLFLFTFSVPILNVLVVGVLKSPGHNLKLTTIALNLLWFGIAGWMTYWSPISQLVSEGLFDGVALVALGSAVVIHRGLKRTGHLVAK